mmetsp:Transcript_11361/g.17046  ORF Transcript_11361/g.17046 Transcript_11361/m.17046 type:complete len:264 (+) Transcript_11361:1151-1942(+)
MLVIATRCPIFVPTTAPTSHRLGKIVDPRNMQSAPADIVVPNVIALFVRTEGCGNAISLFFFLLLAASTEAFIESSSSFRRINSFLIRIDSKSASVMTAFFDKVEMSGFGRSFFFLYVSKIGFVEFKRFSDSRDALLFFDGYCSHIAVAFILGLAVSLSFLSTAEAYSEVASVPIESSGKVPLPILVLSIETDDDGDDSEVASFRKNKIFGNDNLSILFCFPVSFFFCAAVMALEEVVTLPTTDEEFGNDDDGGSVRTVEDVK